jgi:ADP-dependent NAD(P)H-hydrate dehydratase / NAD(P)H-hydrate epimerase
MKALTASEMREVDRLTTERFGIPSLQLMESAGQKVADAVWRVVAAHENVRICVLCGKGNNGGDGFVAARCLREAGLSPRVLLFGKPEDVLGDAAANLARWRDAGDKIEHIVSEADWERSWPEVISANVIVDAMLGTGLRGAATGLVARAISDINELTRNATLPRPALILSVDTPSGLSADGDAPSGPVLSAHRTVTFTAPKVGQLISHHAEACGALEIVRIGSPFNLIEEMGKGMLRLIGPDEFLSLPLVRQADGHKGKFGHVLLVAGSAGKSGAAALSGFGALRAGAGLVTIAVPAAVQIPVAAAHAEYMTEVMECTADGAISRNNLESGRMARIAAGKTVLAVGPGLGTHSETQEFIVRVTAESELPVILDADGLNAFAGRSELLPRRKMSFLAVTPHPGEMARLLGTSTAMVQENRVALALDSARKWNAHVILKGFHTLIASPDGKLFVNNSGNPGLAKGGSGDVLTGILAALTAQFGTADWARVLALGVYLHGMAADLLAAEGNEDISGMLATEVAGAVPRAREYLLREIRFGA